MPSPSPHHFVKAASALAALQHAAGKVNDAVASPADGDLERAPLTTAPNDKQHREAMIEEARVKHYQDQPFSSSAMIGGALGLGLPSVVAALTDPGAFTRHPGKLLQYSLATGLTGMGAGLGSEALGRVLTRQFGPKFAPSRWHRDQDPHRWNTALRTAPLGVALLAGRTLPAMFDEMKKGSIDQDLRDRIAAANAKVAVPSLKEIESGTYQKGHYTWKGFPLTIETAKGQTRSGVNSVTKKPWSITLTNSYGYIKGTDSAEPGDEMDIFMGDHPESEVVFCVDQNKQDGKTFDEHKLVAGELNMKDAKELYMRNYSAGWKGFRDITPLTLPQLRSWLVHGDMTKPLAGQQFADFHKRANSLAW